MADPGYYLNPANLMDYFPSLRWTGQNVPSGSGELATPPPNPSAPPQGLQRAAWDTAIQPMYDIGMGVGAAREQGLGSPEVGAALMAAMGLITPMRKPGIRAYHGSPHDFDRFDISKIGTGEGAQAYGHGLYFAENPKTAQSYRDIADATVGGRPFDINNPAHKAAALVDELGSPEAALAQAKSYAARDFAGKGGYYGDVVRILERGKLPEFKSQGKMYEVSIAAKPEQFLDWDRPLAGQPEHFSRLREAGVIGDKSPPYQKSGQATPQALVQMPGEKGAIEAQLRDAGIPGIRYLDQGSRSAADFHAMKEGDKFFAANYDKTKQAGPFNSREDTWNWINSEKQRLQTSNYVLFRDDIIDILKKYGIAGLAAFGAWQGPGDATKPKPMMQ
jgi:hypothetical protein